MGKFYKGRMIVIRLLLSGMIKQLFKLVGFFMIQRFTVLWVIVHFIIKTSLFLHPGMNKYEFFF